jgi:hypothetical protein
MPQLSAVGVTGSATLRAGSWRHGNTQDGRASSDARSIGGRHEPCRVPAVFLGSI